MTGSKSWQAASAGTYVDSSAPRGVAGVFLVLAFLVLLAPLVAMLWAPTSQTTENRELAPLPQLVDEGSLNASYLSDLGAYFDDHFAYRNELVDANAHLRAAFGVSATDQVVLGCDGWLYYGGTLPDYLGQEQLSDRALFNIAHNLSVAQGYVESQGATFLFTLAPNKNSLDGSDMPYYYLPSPNASNAERLKPFLDQAGVRYLDLFTYFEEAMDAGEGFHYLKQDSHWDNYWAMRAAGAIQEALGQEGYDLSLADAEVRKDFTGDLESMLYPTSASKEDNYYFAGYNDAPQDTGSLWSYEEGSAVTDDTVRTRANGDGEGASLLMLRDSFGNALIPFLAASYDTAHFSKLIPYNLAQVSTAKPRSVVVERAERHLSYLASHPPIMAAPRYEGVRLPAGAQEAQASVDLQESGSYWLLSGQLSDADLQAGTDLRIVVTLADGTALTYIPFYVSATDDDDLITSDAAFSLYVSQAAVDLSTATVRVYRLS